MEYPVPQFVEIESKVVGPLTLKQFIYLAGAAGICTAAFLWLPLFLAVPISLLFGGLGGALAFYKVNGKSFASMVEAAAHYYAGSKTLVRKQPDYTQKSVQKPPPAISARANGAIPGAHGPRLSRGKLSELAWSLDVQSHERELRENPPRP